MANCTAIAVAQPLQLVGLKHRAERQFGTQSMREMEEYINVIKPTAQLQLRWAFFASYHHTLTDTMQCSAMQ